MSMLIPPMSIPPIPPMEEVLELMPPVEVAVMVMDEPPMSMSIVWSISTVW